MNVHAQQVPHVAAVVVTYHPAAACRDLLMTLAQQCGHVIVVDNGSTPQETALLRNWCRDSGALLIELCHNTGIAAAQNAGIERARELGARRVLLSDDDSRPSELMVRQLEDVLATWKGREPLAAVGPLVGEEKPGGDQLVYVSRTWGPRRATSAELGHGPLPVAFLIASGCLIDIEALDSIGSMDERLFIDHVDLEWGLRARRQGFVLLVVPEARMRHSLGDETAHVMGRRQPVHVHQPVRNYYLVRNTILLIGSGVLGPKWSIGYVVWLIKYVAFNALLANQRWRRTRMILRGFRDGLRGRSGPIPHQ